MPGLIITQYDSTCRDCGAKLPAGSKARYYGRGYLYGVDCHPQLKGRDAAMKRAESKPVKVYKSGPFKSFAEAADANLHESPPIGQRKAPIVTPQVPPIKGTSPLGLAKKTRPRSNSKSVKGPVKLAVYTTGEQALEAFRKLCKVQRTTPVALGTEIKDGRILQVFGIQESPSFRAAFDFGKAETEAEREAA